jgi:hypothetical protein
MRFNIHDLPALVGLLAPKYADAALAVDHVVSIADHSAPVPEGHDEHYVPQVGGYVTVKQPTPGATSAPAPTTSQAPAEGSWEGRARASLRIIAEEANECARDVQALQHMIDTIINEK